MVQLQFKRLRLRDQWLCALPQFSKKSSRSFIRRSSARTKSSTKFKNSVKSTLCWLNMCSCAKNSENLSASSPKFSLTLLHRRNAVSDMLVSVKFMSSSGSLKLFSGILHFALCGSSFPLGLCLNLIFILLQRERERERRSREKGELCVTII